MRECRVPAFACAFVSTAAAPSRLAIIDAVKAVASQLIVLHHLAFYGPMADYLQPLIPGVMEWLAAHARIAVQAFLVIGGFLAARSLAPDALGLPARPLRDLLRRYLKLAPPFIAAMALAVLASALARAWMTHESISAPATIAQFAAHALLLHDVLGYEALSAGAWYVAIDFQLYGLLLALLCFGAVVPANARIVATPLIVAFAAVLSLALLNRDSSWDIWAPYFFGSYAFGVLAWWASIAPRRRAAWLTTLVVLLTLLALAIEFRARVAVAATVALLLIGVCRGWLRMPGLECPLFAFLGRISYAVFLLHFPVCLVINAAFARFAPATALVQGGGVLLAWLASIGAGYLFHRWVEQPMGAWTGRTGRHGPVATAKANGPEAMPQARSDRP